MKIVCRNYRFVFSKIITYSSISYKSYALPKSYNRYCYTYRHLA
ncbi:hypothetical protein TSAR_003428 [Trichomalopsis sarcophagae]|uniref:Uncharacterized protein n=1 Tax=Trichomalopsis sarcophagae TaxID=543379 RepID=A0A232FJI4_9HYME|nr:hypothetical protein TSAR_003428 [Trichomalopsis sarcophagae]